MVLLKMAGFQFWCALLLVACATAEKCSTENEAIPMPDVNDCSKFIQCIDGEAIHTSCPPGLHFNPKDHVCEYPQDAGCEASHSSSEEPATTKKPEEPTPPVGTTTEASGNNPVCSEDGAYFLPHPSDCTKYLECVDHVLYTLPCPEGLHFNNDKKTCDYPENAGCEKVKRDEVETTTYDNGRPPILDDPDCPDKGIVFLPDPKNCSTFFECVEGDKYPFVCPPGLHFNPTAEICDYPGSAGCTAQEKLSNKNEAESTTIYNGSPPSIEDPNCSKEGVYYVPDPTDCTVFYQCVNGNKYEFYCTGGLHFNPTLDVCDYPVNAGCDPAPKRVAREVKETTTVRPDRPPIVNDPDCPQEEGVSYLRHPTDCTQYYECVDGNKFEFQCPAGLHFNMNLHVCDFPKHAGCDPAPTRLLREDNEETSTARPEKPPSINDPDCPQEDGVSFLPHPTDCTQYFQCVDGNKYEFECPGGLHFNLEKGVCDYPKNAGCEKPKNRIARDVKEETTVNPEKPPIVNDPACNKDGVFFLPYPSDCTKYFECVDGNKFEFQCPAGLHFNLKLNACDFPKNAGCDPALSRLLREDSEVTSTARPEKPPSINDPDCPQEDGASFLPHPSDCTQYFQCVDGNKYEFECPGALHFNLEKGVCDFPKNAGCDPAYNRR